MPKIKSRKIVFNFIWYILVIATITFLIIYDKSVRLENKGRGFRLDNYLQDHAKYGGYQGERLAKIVNISEDYLYIRTEGKILKVYGKGVKMPILGESVFFLDFGKDGNIRMIAYHNYDYNYLLYAVSFVSLVVFAVIFFKDWKFTRGGFGNA